MSVLRIVGRIIAGFLILIIRGYQVALAPLLIGGCRHLPSCSEYAEEALRKHGLREGVRLAANRLWRCRPKGSFGYDPVP
jgi:putative membrane protein insertion efficiency factor